MPTPLMADLQKMGLTPNFMAAGVPVVANDWIPDQYILMVALSGADKPMRYRVPEGLKSSAIQFKATDPNAQYKFIEEYWRWLAAKIVQPGAGAAYYLGGAAWVDASYGV
jgi:hypothetical protein